MIDSHLFVDSNYQFSSAVYKCIEQKTTEELKVQPTFIFIMNAKMKKSQLFVIKSKKTFEIKSQTFEIKTRTFEIKTQTNVSEKK